MFRAAEMIKAAVTDSSASKTDAPVVIVETTPIAALDNAASITSADRLAGKIPIAVWARSVRRTTVSLAVVETMTS